MNNKDDKKSIWAMLLEHNTLMGIAAVITAAGAILAIVWPSVAEMLRPTQTPTFTPTLTASPSPTSTPTPSPTPCPGGVLCEIFPQVGDGEAFVFINPPGSLTDQLVEDCRYSGRYGLRLTYAFSEAGNGGWGVHWHKAPLRHFNASRFSAIEFWVRGAAGDETFQIGLKDTDETEVKVESKPLVVLSPSEWVKVRVDLGKFAGVNTASIRNVNFGFNRDHGTGSICIDDIAFVSP